MKAPTISIVIPTRNSETTLGLCLESIKGQTYPDYELIIVDGFSTDKTLDTARNYTDKIFTSNASLPASRNFGYSKAKGEIFISIDSDMILQNDLLSDIVSKIRDNQILVIPEVGYGSNFLSKCKDLEKRCYLNDETIESARVFTRKIFTEAGGYDPDLLFGEDWDFHSRIKDIADVGRTSAHVFHNTQHLSMISDLKKAYSYGYSLPRYLAKKHPQARKWLSLKRFFFIRNFNKLKKQPVLSIGLLVIKSLEYLFGFAGYVTARIKG